MSAHRLWLTVYGGFYLSVQARYPAFSSGNLWIPESGTVLSEYGAERKCRDCCFGRACAPGVPVASLGHLVIHLLKLCHAVPTDCLGFEQTHFSDGHVHRPVLTDACY